jgi:hypothetical protein
MSLVSSASPWISDEPQRKRPATMRKTIKKTSSLDVAPSDTTHLESSSYVSQEQTYQETKPVDRQERVNEMIQQMNSIHTENDGQGLADFKPLSHPVVRKRANEQISGDDSLSYLPNVHIPTPPADFSSNLPKDPVRPTFSASNLDLDKNSDYHRIYQPPPSITHAPYLGGRAGPSVSQDHTKMMDKINYMIHLLEEQSNEKTGNVMEEFVMFSLVGVFIIYVLDSFSRSGRYVR